MYARTCVRRYTCVLYVRACALPLLAFLLLPGESLPPSRRAASRAFSSSCLRRREPDEVRDKRSSESTGRRSNRANATPALFREVLTLARTKPRGRRNRGKFRGTARLNDENHGTHLPKLVQIFRIILHCTLAIILLIFYFAIKTRVTVALCYQEHDVFRNIIFFIAPGVIHPRSNNVKNDIQPGCATANAFVQTTRRGIGSDR